MRTGEPADGFGRDNLPYGMAVLPGAAGASLVVRIGDQVLDVTGAGGPASLDALLAAGPGGWAANRELVSSWLADEGAAEALLHPLTEVRMQLPFTVADYVDCYASEQHATNAGRIFRPDSDPLPANWKHMPLAYHGRAGTVVVSGTDVRRPRGPFRQGGAVVVGPTRRMDFEAEVAFVVGAPSHPDRPVSVAEFGRHVFGVVLLDDWSARDIQAWETVPLGPFLGKSFATSISAWVTPLSALDSAWVPPPARDVALPGYLDDAGRTSGLDLQLEVWLNGELLSRPPFASMYWTPAQLLAHLTVNGAALRTGDLVASGTVSGLPPNEWGSLLELTWNGTRPILLRDGTERAFLADGDEVTLRATAPGIGGRIALGEVSGRIRP